MTDESAPTHITVEWLHVSQGIWLTSGVKDEATGRIMFREAMTTHSTVQTASWSLLASHALFSALLSCAVALTVLVVAGDARRALLGVLSVAIGNAIGTARQKRERVKALIARNH